MGDDAKRKLAETLGMAGLFGPSPEEELRRATEKARAVKAADEAHIRLHTRGGVVRVAIMAVLQGVVRKLGAEGARAALEAAIKRVGEP